MNWDDIRIFLEVARKGSIRSASLALKVNQSTVSRRIKAFEKKEGISLFTKLPSGYVLTDVGRDILNSAKEVEHKIYNIERNLHQKQNSITKTINLTLPIPLALHLLVPDLSTYGKLNPNVKLIINASNTELNLSKRETDIAIRLTNSPPGHLIGKRLFRFTKSIYVSQDLASKISAGLDPDNLDWLGWDGTEEDYTWISKTDFPNNPVHHSAKDINVHIEAAKNGMGMAILPCFIADRIPQLRRIDPNIRIPSDYIWILIHKDMIKSKHIKQFVDYLYEKLYSYKNLFDGIL